MQPNQEYQKPMSCLLNLEGNGPAHKTIFLPEFDCLIVHGRLAIMALYFLIVLGWGLCSVQDALGQGFFDMINRQNRSKTSESKLTKTMEEMQLTDKQGPVMIKVASFVGPEHGQTALLLANEISQKCQLETYIYHYKAEDELAKQNELMHELRRLDIEAIKERYQKTKDGKEIKVVVSPTIMKAAYVNPPEENWVVMAGNFESLEARTAHQALKRVQNLSVESISAELLPWQFDSNNSNKLSEDERFRGVAAVKSNKLGSSAVLTRNPLLADQENQVGRLSAKEAELLIQMNDGPMSVYQIRQPLTIRVAMFSGSRVVGVEKARSILNRLTEENSPLQHAGANAELITTMLREKNIPAFVFHGKFGSMVCVGGYGSVTDPRLQEDVRRLTDYKLGQATLAPFVILTPQHPLQPQCPKFQKPIIEK